MLLENTKRELESSGTLQVSRATIKATPKIFNFFADQTYADKPVAICRELVANAVDAHTAAGTPDVPVEVHLPTPLEPVFKVRDYGIGMAHDFVMNDFMRYTDGSTKDSSNDQIGGFGIGSKSPFAYCDQFTLRVVHDGVLSIYTMFKDTDGVPAIGLQGQKVTDEHNGVEVSFPVEEADMNAFRDAAAKALKYFKPLPVVENGNLVGPDYSYEGKGWGLRAESGELGVVMGGIRYPVAMNSLEYDLRTNSTLSPLLSYGIDIELPIGSCGIALSREALSYDKRTSDNIRKGLENILSDVVKTFSTMFDMEPTRWEAAKKLHQELGSRHYSYTPRQKLLAANAVYKGEKLESYIDIQKLSGFVVWEILERGWKDRKITTAKWEVPAAKKTLYPHAYERILIDDLPNSPKSKLLPKIKEYFESVPRKSSSLVFRLWSADQNVTVNRADKAAIKAMLESIGNPVEVVYTSSLPEPLTLSVAKAKNVRPKVRMFTFTGSSHPWTNHRFTNLQPGYDKRDIVKEIPYVDQPATGILVVMTAFELPAGFYDKMDTGLIKYDELHFVNQGDAPALETSFQKFEDVFQQRLDAKLKSFKNAAEKLAVSKSHELKPYFKFIQETGLKPTRISKPGPFKEMVELFEKYVRPINEEPKFANFITPKLPLGLAPAKLVEKFRKEQPDAELLMDIINAGSPKHVDLFLRNL